MAVDLNVTIGPWPTDDQASWSVADVNAHLDRFGLDAALVRHSIAVDYDPVTGNRVLTEELHRAGPDAARLLPSFVLGPLDTGEHGDPGTLPERLAAAGVRAIWLYPGSHLWSLTGPEAESLVAALRSAALPVLLRLDEASCSEIGRFADAAPELDIVVCDVGYRSTRPLLALLDQHPRIHVDLSFLAAQSCLELFSRRYGPERVLLGTGAPQRDDTAAMLVYGSATDRARREARAAQLLGPFNRADGGRPTQSLELPGDVVDIHAHIGGWPNTWLPEQDADALVAAMDRSGISVAAISHLRGIWSDPVGGNEEALDAAGRHPGRLVVHLVADPHRPRDRALLVDQLGRPDVVGIKVHPHTHACPIDDRRYDWIWELAVEHRKPVLAHGFAGTSHSDPLLFGPVADRNPGLRLLVGHSGATPEGFRRTIAVCTDRAGLYAETSGSWMTGRWLRRLVDALGADRVLHGTDACVMDLRYGLGRILGAPLTPNERAAVLAGNARTIFTLPPIHGGH